MIPIYQQGPEQNPSMQQSIAMPSTEPKFLPIKVEVSGTWKEIVAVKLGTSLMCFFTIAWILATVSYFSPTLMAMAYGGTVSQVAELKASVAELQMTSNILAAKVEKLETSLEKSSCKDFQAAQKEIITLLKHLGVHFEFDVDEEAKNVQSDKNVQCGTAASANAPGIEDVNN